LCQGGDRPLGDPGVRHLWGVVSIDQQGRPCLGQRLHAKSNLVHYQAGSVKLLSFSRNAHDLRRTGARLCHQAGGELEQIQFLLGHVSVQTAERYVGCKQRFRNAVNEHIGLEPGSS
jgi:integrase